MTTTGSHLRKSRATEPPRSGDERPVRSVRKNTSPRNRRLAWYVGLILITAVVLYPVVWLLGASFKSGAEIFGNASVLPDAPTLDNYRVVLEGIGGIPLWRFAVNSVLLAVLSVVGVVASSSLSAYAFARITFAGRKILFAIMIATLLLPVHVVIIPQYILFQSTGLLDTYAPLLIGKFLATEAFFVFLFVQFIRTIPREIDEAARIDGCNHWGIFRRMILPLLRPAIITASIFAFIWTWNEFFGPLLYLSSPEKYTLPLALRLYMDSTSAANYGAVLAMSMLALVPVLLFFVVFQRLLIEGVATQGVKG